MLWSGFCLHYMGFKEWKMSKLTKKSSSWERILSWSCFFITSVILYACLHTRLSWPVSRSHFCSGLYEVLDKPARMSFYKVNFFKETLWYSGVNVFIYHYVQRLIFVFSHNLPCVCHRGSGVCQFRTLCWNIKLNFFGNNYVFPYPISEVPW